MEILNNFNGVTLYCTLIIQSNNCGASQDFSWEVSLGNFQYEKRVAQKESNSGRLADWGKLLVLTNMRNKLKRSKTI